MRTIITMLFCVRIPLPVLPHIYVYSYEQLFMFQSTGIEYTSLLQNYPSSWPPGIWGLATDAISQEYGKTFHIYVEAIL